MLTSEKRYLIKIVYLKSCDYMDGGGGGGGWGRIMNIITMQERKHKLMINLGMAFV